MQWGTGMGIVRETAPRNSEPPPTVPVHLRRITFGMIKKLPGVAIVLRGEPCVDYMRQ